eukprot:CAMPEP_0117043984 /NCGR_PEP_ID=MMETSP0472-20121206/30526_1 /TAXON_ID=693140 ORGANISM="Tiarina fusus, Strain LIS" /NCGR_SAMPLE_ID=MMETSP0472 /ASSEMBLY_ACC=CAM_ASM_000603 /LENGTH=1236 /DNA_ID=CAMNT_0004755623 /DNA_START=47 /DNA_END=3759 /DNA_ORIENTATION=+
MKLFNSGCAAVLFIGLPNAVVGSWSTSTGAGIQRVKDVKQRRSKISVGAWNSGPPHPSFSKNRNTDFEKDVASKTLLRFQEESLPASSVFAEHSVAHVRKLERKINDALLKGRAVERNHATPNDETSPPTSSSMTSRTLQEAPPCPWTNAIPIAYDPTQPILSVIGTTTGGLANLPDSSDACSANSGSATAWYTFTTTTSVDSLTTISFTTCSPLTTFDTKITVFQEDADLLAAGDECPAICTTSNDDHGSNLAICSEDSLHSLATITVSDTEITRYYVAVSGFDEFEVGDFELQIITIDGESGTFPPTTDGDGACPFIAAIPVDINPDGTPTVVAGTTLGADGFVPNFEGCSANLGTAAQWYKVGLEVEATLIASTCSLDTNFDTVLHLFQEADFDDCTGSCLGGNDDHNTGGDLEICVDGELVHSFLGFREVLPGTYYIVVSGYGEEDKGEILALPPADTPSPTGSSPPSPPTPTAPPVPGVCPLISAVPVNYELTVEYELDGVVVVSGTTEGGVANLPGPGETCSNQASPTFWYKIEIAADDLTLVATSCTDDTTFDTTLTIFQELDEATCDYVCLGRNDDHGLSTADLCSLTTHSFIAVEGLLAGTYYIAVSGFNPLESGVYGLLVGVFEPDDEPGQTPTTSPSGSGPTAPTTPAPTPEFDCPLTSAIPINLDAGSVSITGSTSGATSNLPDVPDCSSNTGSPTVWYQFTTAVDGTIFVSTCGSTFDTVITLFRSPPGGDCSNAFCLGANDDHGTTLPECSDSTLHSYIGVVSSPPADTFYVAVSGFSQFDSGQFVLDVSVDSTSTASPTATSIPTATPTSPTPPVPTASNSPTSTFTTAPTGTPDDGCPFRRATFLQYDAAGLVVSGSTLGAASNLPELGDCSVNLGAPTVWYKFQTVDTASIVITTCSPFTDFDTVLNVYEEVSEADCSVTCLDRSDDHATDLEICAPNIRHSILGFRNLPPGTYYVAVSGYAEAGGVCAGEFELEFQTIPSDTTAAPTMAPVSPPTKAPITVAPGGPAPTLPTVAPVDKPRPTLPPTVPDEPVTTSATDLSIEIEPVPGPFDKPLGVDIVQAASSAFFAEVLFGESRDVDAARFVDAELLEYEVIEVGGLVARNKLLVVLNVNATYDGEEDLKGVLVRAVDDNQDLYISILQQTEAELSEELDDENLEYFSAVESITVVGEGSSTPKPAPPSGVEPTVQLDSGAKLVGVFSATGLIGLVAIFGTIFQAL